MSRQRDRRNTRRSGQQGVSQPSGFTGYDQPDKAISPSAVRDPVTGLTPAQQAVIDSGGTIRLPQRRSQRTKGPMTPAERAGVSPSNPNRPVNPITGLPVTGPVGTPPTPETPAGPTPAEQAEQEARDKDRRDSRARLNGTLADYGLESLADTVWTWLQEGLSEAEIVQRMRGTDQFKQRFPAIEQRAKKGLAPISPGEYVAYERQARQVMRAAGLPMGYYDSNEDFQKFLVNDMSLAELGDRVTLAANAAFKLPKEDRDALAAWGMGPGDLTAFWLDPDKATPLLERKYAAAQLAGAGTRTGFGRLGESKATELATLGVTAAEAEQGFGQLVQSKELFQSLDRGENVIDQDEQISARFQGNAAAQRRIENRRRRRQGVFETGGSFAASQQGLTGLGDASDF